MSGLNNEVEPGMLACGFLGSNLNLVHGAGTDNLQKADLHNSLKSSGANLTAPTKTSEIFACQAIENQPVKLDVGNMAPALSQKLEISANLSL